MENLSQTPESLPEKVPPQPGTPLEKLLEWQAMAAGAYAKNTLRAQKADGKIFQGFCEGRGEQFFPAAPKTIRAFIEWCTAEGKKPATTRRYVATIARIHMAAGLLSPCASEAVRLALKEMGKKTSARQRQALALGWKEIKEFIETAGEGLAAARARAMLCVAYDTMARRSELVAFDVEDIEWMPNGSGTMLIRRSKTDQEGQGSVGYLSRETVKWLKAWLADIGVQEGAIFRRLHGQGAIGERLHADRVADIFKAIAKWIGMSEMQVNHVSGHSVRVGAAQDLLTLNIELSAIMQAGRWRSTRMPLKYGERVSAHRSGMAQAAQQQGRT